MTKNGRVNRILIQNRLYSWPVLLLEQWDQITGWALLTDLKRYVRASIRALPRFDPKEVGDHESEDCVVEIREVEEELEVVWTKVDRRETSDNPVIVRHLLHSSQLHRSNWPRETWKSRNVDDFPENGFTAEPFPNYPVCLVQLARYLSTLLQIRNRFHWLGSFSQVDENRTETAWRILFHIDQFLIVSFGHLMLAFGLVNASQLVMCLYFKIYHLTSFSQSQCLIQNVGCCNMVASETRCYQIKDSYLSRSQYPIRRSILILPFVSCCNLATVKADRACSRETLQFFHLLYSSANFSCPLWIASAVLSCLANARNLW